ncbi:hypothetical protein O6H91_Y538800 [Diphasiastrum complanatum]|nr:hypothetical protein O6H91_Y538800 [Diphasiastrum complanatum]
MIMAASSSHEPAAASNRPCCSSSCCCFSLAAAAAAAAAASDQQQQTVVMTDEQLKTFRGQLTTYATICAQLVETHNKQSNPQPSARAGLEMIIQPVLCNPCCPRLEFVLSWFSRMKHGTL